jgi:hypothetical protein
MRFVRGLFRRGKYNVHILRVTVHRWPLGKIDAVKKCGADAWYFEPTRIGS